MTKAVSESQADYALGVGHSFRGQAWKFRCQDESLVEHIARDCGVDALSARILAGRGLKPADVEGFLNPTLKSQLPNPSSIQDMDKAASLIMDAVEARKHITVFADYDVDGGTSAAQLIRWGRAFGHEFGLYVPDRVEEGYGPSVEAFQSLKADGADLVITVDCGAAAHEALHAARDIDLPIIVVDHHLMQGENPPCAALVNPNREDDTSGLGHLAAAGVTFMLLVALNREARKRGLSGEPNLLSLLGLTAMGTVCDVVPLTDINRVFVSQGLKVLSENNILGVNALKDEAGVTGAVTGYDIGFVLGPRINAGGRIGRSDMGAELLSTENAQIAHASASELDRVNRERKAMQDRVLSEAVSMLDERNPVPVIVVAGEGWHPGVVGIVAGRLKDRFERPAIVIGIDENGLGKGSGRSMTGVNLGAAIVAAKRAGLATSGGGHEMAAGVSLDKSKINEFRDFLVDRLRADVEKARAGLSLKVDSLVFPAAITPAFIDNIDRIGPYGAGNPQPVFAMADMRIAFAQRLKGGHIRFAIEDSSGGTVRGICFRAEESGLDELLLAPDAPRIHAAGRLKRNNWQGRESIDFQLVDIAIA